MLKTKYYNTQTLFYNRYGSRKCIHQLDGFKQNQFSLNRNMNFDPKNSSHLSYFNTSSKQNKDVSIKRYPLFSQLSCKFSTTLQNNQNFESQNNNYNTKNNEKPKHQQHEHSSSNQMSDSKSIHPQEQHHKLSPLNIHFLDSEAVGLHSFRQPPSRSLLFFLSLAALFLLFVFLNSSSTSSLSMLSPLSSSSEDYMQGIEEEMQAAAEMKPLRTQIKDEKEYQEKIHQIQEAMFILYCTFLLNYEFIYGFMKHRNSKRILKNALTYDGLYKAAALDVLEFLSRFEKYATDIVRPFFSPLVALLADPDHATAAAQVIMNMAQHQRTHTDICKMMLVMMDLVEEDPNPVAQRCVAHVAHALIQNDKLSERVTRTGIIRTVRKVYDESSDRQARLYAKRTLLASRGEISTVSLSNGDRKRQYMEYGKQLGSFAGAGMIWGTWRSWFRWHRVVQGNKKPFLHGVLRRGCLCGVTTAVIGAMGMAAEYYGRVEAKRVDVEADDASVQDALGSIQRRHITTAMAQVGSLMAVPYAVPFCVLPFTVVKAWYQYPALVSMATETSLLLFSSQFESN
eukprot:gb/GECH01004357.1/.p1 GENE.gb/GECH01004357.1/~~gb/GECH01004357.1/.p1  ORF type:complete len:568 (+),score=140.24 gb/GECH01004357.1/:1-1704(+)